MLLAGLAIHSVDAAPAPKCVVSDAFTIGVRQVKKVRVPSYEGDILYFKSHMNVNTDGAPTSYHLDGKSAGAMNTLCNGANIYLSAEDLAQQKAFVGYLTKGERAELKDKGATAEEIKKASIQKCAQFDAYLQQARKAQWDQKTFPRVDFYAVATDGNGKPCEITSGPWKGFLVSTAAVADRTRGACSPSRYLDATRHKAIVVPKKSDFTPVDKFAVYNGNLTLVQYGKKQEQAIVGDQGPPDGLGEGTPALGWALNGYKIGVDKASAVQLRDAMPEAQIDPASVRYFVLVESSVAYPTQKPRIDPDELKFKALTKDAIDGAFSQLPIAKITKELKSCAL